MATIEKAPRLDAIGTVLETDPRICILTETYYPVVGGGETQARSLARGLVDRGLQVVVVTRRSDAKFRRVEQIDGITVNRLPPSGRQHLKKWGLLVTAIPALIRLRGHYDVIFVSGFRIIGIPAVLVSKLLGRICVLKADSTGEMSGVFFDVGLAKAGIKRDSIPFRTFLSLRNYLFQKADSFVAISSELGQEFVDGHVAPHKIRYIPNSVDTALFHPVDQQEKERLRTQLNLPQEIKIVIYTGRLVSYKGLPLLLEVWHELQDKRADACLLLVGSGGMDIQNCENELKEYVAENKLEEKVIFAGAVENVHEYLQAADIFVFPTENEAFGISVIEAMACGLPVIATSVGGLKDILQSGQNGLVIQANNRKEIRLALDRLLGAAELRQSLGQMARHTAEEQFAQATVAEAYVDLFRELLKASSRAEH